METRQPTTVSAEQLSAAQDDRSNLLKDLATLTLEAAHGVQQMNDQQISHLLGGLVRSKLISADDSYLLKDRLLDGDAMNQALDHRIEAALKRKGLLTDAMIRQARNGERAT